MPQSAPTRTKQPNSLHCFVCGLRNPVGLRLAFYEIGPGEVMSTITVPERYQGYPGVVHGGVVAAMLDEVVGRAAMDGDPWRFMMTAKLDLRYRKPIPIGQPLRLVGRMLKRHGRLATTHGELWLEDGTLGAEAEAVLSDITGMPDGTTDLEALGWKVYPDESPDSGSEG